MVVQEDDVNQLPSRQLYGEFSASDDYCGKRSTIAQMEPHLQNPNNELGITVDGMERIVKALCSAYRKKMSNSSNDDYCYALYYWIGSTILIETKHVEPFPRIMQGIYEILKGAGIENVCTGTFPNIRKGVFDQRKRVFDYYNNFNTICSYLQSNKLQGGGNYSSYLAEVATVYDDVNRYCASNGEDSYCTGLKGIFDDGRNPKELNSKCVLMHKPETISEAAGREQKLCLDQLPSNENFYSKFDSGKHSCADGTEATGVISALEGKLQGGGSIGSYASTIVDSYCYACTESRKKDSTPDDKPCHFFYYWIGNFLPKYADASTISGLISSTYAELTHLNQNACPQITTPNHVGWTLFQQRKLVFDYYNDHEKIQEQVRQQKCLDDENYTEHIQNITTACKSVTVDCGPEGGQQNNDQYCSWFNSKKGENEDYCSNKKLSELKAALSLKPQVVSETAQVHMNHDSLEERQLHGVLQPHEASTPSSSTATIVPAIMGVGGLPALAFFLYKVSMKL
ncbi:KIR protein [Plasmodium coatneyi]|uniref:KIR protein n=1 Tax=Plasmodium coatneyi TaxID=208452 RepID=A0A1B1DSI3_9APIC|nr:KIR protein [Plasmodium coatneyi]ANQ05702.1 KIR protein [Plasmodium coatneyi]